MKKMPMFLNVLLGIGLLIISCKQEAKKPLEFYYYPDLNLYFDVAKQHYVFSLDGGSTWDTTKGADQGLPPTLGEKVVLQSVSDSIWKYNTEHLQKYGGSLYTIVDEDDTVAPAADEMVTEKKVEKKRVKKAEAVPDEKRKKGLKKFLNKIFGKKKNKDNQQ